MFVEKPIMTKKSKRKAAKTGSRGGDGPRITTFSLSLDITKNRKFYFILKRLTRSTNIFGK